MTTIPPSGGHVARRARERYGVELTWEDIDGMAARIQAGQSVLAARNPDGSERHLVAWAGVEMVVVWRPDRQCIVTVVKPSSASRGYATGALKTHHFPKARSMSGKRYRRRAKHMSEETSDT